MSARLFHAIVLSCAVASSACAFGNVGGDVSTSPVGASGPSGPVVSPGTAAPPGPVLGGTPTTSREPAALSGGIWMLTALGERSVTPAVRNPAHLAFALPNGVSGATGCNRMTGGVTIEGDAMRFQAMAATRMACVDEADVEGAFLAALDAARAWDVTAGVLTLRDADGAVVATFDYRASLAR